MPKTKIKNSPKEASIIFEKIIKASVSIHHPKPVSITENKKGK